MDPLFRPSTLLALFKEGSVFPKRALSQNFLIDGNIVRKIVQAADIREGETVVEIGAGSGVLTQALLEKKAHVIAVEKDPFFATHLASLKKEYPDLEIYQEDFLCFPFRQKIKKKIKLLSNLPYHLTTPIFLRLFELSSCFSTITLMLQKEAASRILSPCKTKNYGALSVFTHLYTDARLLFDISPHCFNPSPKVHSTLIQLELKRSFPQKIQKPFHQMVQRAFQQRRKKLTSSLKELYSQEGIKRSLLAMALKEEARPEELNSSEFLHLFELLYQIKTEKTFDIGRERLMQPLP
jgi:16S rRNA (adenine1518-N6/adenine1519-N6)-dimethyltransferase